MNDVEDLPFLSSKLLPGDLVINYVRSDIKDYVPKGITGIVLSVSITYKNASFFNRPFKKYHFFTVDSGLTSRAWCINATAFGTVIRGDEVIYDCTPCKTHLTDVIV